ncbi:hypothetical protein M408DRAFT_20278 [Serendipita vermifera MAFF 305830]|uniref:F-box domain-containing protein n=1 Tax=Serendipita vermifera MAFF 305830 TaxID=933852 RepID=A0A0C3BNB4_SERVB|nr:hypothetical protein M408DRAFT_20278 [Serendipita vermifera MAFF 305830]
MSPQRVPRRCLKPRAANAISRTLAIDELLHMITSHLCGESKTLLALSTSCKTWSTIALQMLWAQISSDQLTRIIAVVNNTGSASTLSKVYTERLQRTRVLLTTGSTDIPNDQSGLPTTLRPRTIISLDTAHSIPTRLLTPHLTTLILTHDRGIWDTKWLADFNRDIHLVSSSLKVLEISLIPRPASIAIIQKISGMRALRRLKLTLTDDCAYSWLQQGLPVNDDFDSPVIGLDSLEELDIEAPIPIVQTILSATGKELRKLRITGAPFDSAELMAGLFAQIGQGPWTASTTHLRYGVSNRWPLVGDWEDSLEEWGIPYLDPDTTLISAEYLRPLLSLNSLSHLALTFHSHPRIDDLFLATMGANLSVLQSLSICGRDRADEPQSYLSLKGVLALSQLPFLNSLQLPLDLQPSGNLDLGRRLDSVTRLSVIGCLPPTNSDEAVPILTSTFPNLRKVYVRAASYDEDSYDTWSDVWDNWQRCHGAKSLDIEPIYALDEMDELPTSSDDFFVGTVQDAVGVDESESDSIDYLTTEVDLDEYYRRFPDARRHSVNDLMLTTLQTLSV